MEFNVKPVSIEELTAHFSSDRHLVVGSSGGFTAMNTNNRFFIFSRESGEAYSVENLQFFFDWGHQHVLVSDDFEILMTCDFVEFEKSDFLPLDAWIKGVLFRHSDAWAYIYEVLQSHITIMRHLVPEFSPTENWVKACVIAIKVKDDFVRICPSVERKW